MVGSHAANSDSFKVTTLSDQEIRMTRLFNAPRQLVFEAMTRPEHVKQWWGRLGEGYSVPVCEIDLRVGGAWRFVNRHPKGEAVFYGEYREITPPSRLVFTEIFAQFPGQRLGGDGRVHRRGRQDANDGDGTLSLPGRARHGPGVRNGARCGYQLRPPRRPRRGTAAVLTSL